MGFLSELVAWTVVAVLIGIGFFVKAWIQNAEGSTVASCIRLYLQGKLSIGPH